MGHLRERAAFRETRHDLSLAFASSNGSKLERSIWERAEAKPVTESLVCSDSKQSG
jgi:hypothetical protein